MSKIKVPSFYSEEGKVTVLDTKKKALEYIDFLRHDYKGAVAFDTETDSLNKIANKLVSLQFATDDKETFIFFNDAPFCTMKGADVMEVRAALRDLFVKKSNIKRWIIHNAQFDITQVRSQLNFGRWRKIYAPVWDTMVMAFLLDENRDSLSLKNLVNELFGFDKYDQEALEARGSGNLLGLTPKKFTQYAGMDGYVLYRLYIYLCNQAVKEEYFEKMENLCNYLFSPAFTMFTTLSLNGIGVDVDQLKHLMSRKSPVVSRILEIYDEFKEIPQAKRVNDELYTKRAGGVKGLFSKQTPWILDVDKKIDRELLFFTSEKGYFLPANEEGKYSTDKAFQRAYSDTHDGVRLYQELSDMKAMRDKYLKPNYNLLVSHPDCEDGRLHADFLLTGTVTGRSSSRNPNLQQIPRADTPAKRAIKSLYVPRDGYVFIQVDFAANEVRFWGAVAGDPALCSAFNTAFDMGNKFRKNPKNEKLGEEASLLADIHKQTASMMYNVDIKKVDKGLRQVSKTLSLGIMYCRGAYAVAAQLNCDVNEAKDKINTFNKKFKVGTGWSDRQKELMVKHGYVETPLGRRRRCNFLIKEGKRMISEGKATRDKALERSGSGYIASAQRYSVNAPIQATASDYAIIANSLLAEHIRKNKKDWVMVNSVHDSALTEVRMDFDEIMDYVRTTRRILTYDAADYVEEHFGWKMKAHVDIDFEIAQGREKKCSKCGKTYSYPKSSCSNEIKDKKTGEKVKCGGTEFTEVPLNYGYGTLVGWNETEEELIKLASGFSESDYKKILKQYKRRKK